MCGFIRAREIPVSRAGVIYVVGEVLQPSGFVMENKTEYTALRAVAMAHGATKYARLSQQPSSGRMVDKPHIRFDWTRSRAVQIA